MPLFKSPIKIINSIKQMQLSLSDRLLFQGDRFKRPIMLTKPKWHRHYISVYNFSDESQTFSFFKFSRSYHVCSFLSLFSPSFNYYFSIILIYSVINTWACMRACSLLSFLHVSVSSNCWGCIWSTASCTEILGLWTLRRTWKRCAEQVWKWWRIL